MSISWWNVVVVVVLLTAKRNQNLWVWVWVIRKMKNALQDGGVEMGCAVGGEGGGGWGVGDVGG